MRTPRAGVSGPRNFPTFPIQRVAHEETVSALIEQCSGVCFGYLTVNECLLSAKSRHQLGPYTYILNVCFRQKRTLVNLY